MWTTFWGNLHHLHTDIRRKPLPTLISLAALFLGGGSLGLTYFEPLSFAKALGWTAVVAITMLAGIGLVGTLMPAAASSVVTVSPKTESSRKTRLQAYSGHFVLCGWNAKAQQILQELHADTRTAHAPIVVLADLPEKPPEVTHFIRGHVTPGTMEQANLAMARAVIVLGDTHDDAFSSDARAILTTHTIKATYPAVYTCVELLDAQNLSYCQMARADEIVVSDALSSTLLARAARNPGVTRVISDLLHSRQGQELYLTPMPDVVVGQPFLEAMTRLKEDYNALVIAIQSGEGLLQTNPSSTYQMRAVDQLYVIAADRPTFLR